MKQGVMRHRFFICDVFTDTRFGGNQLAVLPDAAGLSDHQMQQITRGFNFAETTFVLPPESGHTRRVRIFTPACEVPFAGHPNVGTAAMLAAHGELGEFGESLQVTFEETAGPVPITIRRRPDGRFWCELAAPEALSLGATVPVPAPKMRPGDRGWRRCIPTIVVRGRGQSRTRVSSRKAG